MERILDGVVPVGAAWAGPESFRHPSCLASLVMCLEHYDGSQLLGGYLNDIEDKELLGRLRLSAGRCLLETHDICWQTWRTMGASHVCEPEKCAEQLRRPEVRRAVAERIECMAENDRRTPLSYRT